ncbi:MAG TPA: aldehyde dehydrogenase family protein [Streptosporangiaceae bacterium]
MLSFADEDEAIELARDTDYGLSLGILGADVTRALALAEQIPARGRAAEDAGLSLRAPR